MPSAGIVYEGALASQPPDGNNNQNQSERTLFKGLKFWISQKAPNRQSLVESVKANGGRKVELEKNADILIADHALKKSAPAGSLSWKYITDSISEGQLVDRDLYTIDHVTAKGVRPGGSTTSTKTTRTPYTPQDDSILIHWVLQKERSGASIRGNQIYRELAQEYPQHTWQSWKDRFKKQYDHQHRHTLATLLPQNYQPPPPAPPPSTAPAPVRKKENVRPGTPPATTTTTVHTPAPGRSQAVSVPATGRVTFTQEDDQDLIRYLKQMKRQGESLQGNLIYKVFAEQHPRHGWQSWRNRWVQTLQATTNLDEDDPAAPNPTEPSLPESTPRATIHPQAKATPQSADQAAAKRRLSAALHRTRQHVPTKSWSSPMGPVKATITSSAHKQSPPRSTPSRLEEINKRARLVHEEKKKIKSASIIQRAWRSYQARKQVPWRQSLIMFQALAQGALVRWACAPAFESQSQQYSEDEGSVDLGQPLEEGVPGPTQTPREQFYVFFNRYNEVIEANPVPWVTIGGKAVDMWDLWTAVTEQDVPANARDWQEIAEVLDFDWIAEPDVPNQLQAAFQEHLAEFENYYKEFQEAQPYELNQGTDEESGEEEESDEADNDQIEAEEEEEEGNANEAEDITLRQDPNTTEFRFSPPIIGALKSSGALKRNSDQMMTSPLARMTRKRPRCDVEDEVPESPSKRWQAPLPPIAEVSSRPELIADVAMINNDDDGAADDMPILGDDGEDYGVEEHREEDEDPFLTQPQQPWQPTVEEALSLRLSSASRSQELSSAQKKSATQPSSKTQAQYISSDSDSDSSSDAFGPPINPARPPPERRRSPIPISAPRPSIETPAAPKQLPPRDTAPASRSPPPRFRIPPDPFASDDAGSSSLHLAPPRQTQRQAQPQSSAHPPPRPSAPRSSLPASAGHQERHQKQHPQSTAPPKPLSHTGRDLGNGIASEDPVAILNRYLARGYKKRHCARGVRATTHDPNVAGRAIDALESGGGLPDNVPGIWTEIDDKQLWRLDGWEESMKRGEDRNEEAERHAREVERRLLEKHGRKRIKLRMEFLKTLKVLGRL